MRGGCCVFLCTAVDGHVNHAFHITQEETVIGCSYAKLAHDVGPSSKILIADGSISLVVTEVCFGYLFLCLWV